MILAAGAGTRIGGVAKALLVGADGRTFLRRIVDSARDAGVADIVVVVGPPFGDTVAAHAQELGARVVVNAMPERGMASSVALGFAALDGVMLQRGAEVAGRGADVAVGRGADVAAGQGVDAAWLWPVDHPQVAPSTLRRLICALMNRDAARPVYQGRGGHPPLIARSLFGRLAACADVDGGARSVLAAADTIDVRVEDPGCIWDVDLPRDLGGI